MIASGHRILPDQFLCGNFRPKVATLGSHIAVSELEPRTGESVCILIRIFQKATRDLFVSWIKTKREIGGQHGWLTHLAGIEGIWNTFRCILSHPLLGSSRTGGQFPFVVEQILKVIDSPLRRSGCPGDLRSSSNSIGSATRSVGTGPTKTLLLNRGTFRFWPHMRDIPSTVGFSKGVTASNESNGFLIVHRHTTKGLTDIVSCSHWVGISVRAFGIYIDETHLHSSERVFKVTLACVALVVEPSALSSPVDIVLCFPNVCTSPAKTKGLKAHGFQGDIAG